MNRIRCIGKRRQAARKFSTAGLINPLVFKRLIVLLLFLLMMNASGVFAAEKSITLGALQPKDIPSGKFLDLVYSEAFRRLGIVFNYKQAPAERASFMSDNGETDGELSRIFSYGETHPNLIRVEEPHWHSAFLAVAMDPSLQLDGWESLTNTEFRVTFVRGIEGCEINLPKVVRPEKLEQVDSIPHGFKKLQAGWTDLFISSDMGIVTTLESDEFRNSGLRIVGVMEAFSSHAFLHKKHKDLVPRLAAVLAEMKKEGLIKKYWKATLEKTSIQNNQNWMRDEG